MGAFTLVIIKRYFHTLRYLRLRQFLWRPYLYLIRKMYSKFGFLRARLHAVSTQLATQLEVRVPGPYQVPLTWSDLNVRDHLAVAAEVERQEFTFLNQTERFKGNIAWSDGQLSRLWRFNLQYQGYLVSLGIAYLVEQRPQSYLAFKAIVRDWQGENPLPRGDGWHPYPVSLRIVNWAMAASTFTEALRTDPVFYHQLKTGLIEQLEYVSRNLEHGVGGNHLLENIKALCVGGAYFVGPGSDRWLRLGLSLLKIELDRQVLADGGHYERSPMYHAIVLEDLVHIAVALNSSGIPWPTNLRENLIKMTRFFQTTLHPDGEIALLNDSAFGIAPQASSLLALVARVLGSGPAGSQLDAGHALLVTGCSGNDGFISGPEVAGLITFPQTGYFVVRRHKTAWLIDAGPVCPDDLPGHAHSDILSYELSINGLRWVVDSGVKEYATGAWRDFARSTRAHNTVSVNGQNQVDVWASFRVGHRVKPTHVSWSTDKEISIITAIHRGFGGDCSHTRVFIDINSEAWLVIDDISGGGNALVENFIHFHPDVRVRPVDHGALLSQGGQTVRLVTSGFDAIAYIHGQQAPLNGWYMPRFGVAQARTTAVCITKALPSLTGYFLSMRSDIDHLNVQRSGSEVICTCCVGGEKLEVRWHSDNLSPTLRRRQL